MRRIGRMMEMCSALALAGASPALAQPLTVQLSEQPPESLPAVDDADYQWIDDADALLDAIGDAPPDFTFAYDGNDIWGWRTSTGHQIYAEPLGGAIRYYYFEPGSREPFLVQDEDFAFGYRPGGRLIVVYDADGRLLSRSEGDREASLADWLYRRGRAIHASAQNDRGWDAVDAGYWAEQVPIIVDLRLRWSSGRDRHPGWRRWHGRAGAAKWRGPLAGERQRRWSDSDRFRRWQRDGFRGPPPRFNHGGPRPVPGVRPPRPGGGPDGVRPPRPNRPDGVRPPRPDRPEEIRPVRPERPGGVRPSRPDRPDGTWPDRGRPPRPDQPGGPDQPRRPDRAVEEPHGAERPQPATSERPRPHRPFAERPAAGTRPAPADGAEPPRFTRPRPAVSPRAEPPQGAVPSVQPVPDGRGRWRPDGGERPRVRPAPSASPPAAAPAPAPRQAAPERPRFTPPPRMTPVERPQSVPSAPPPRSAPPPPPPPRATPAPTPPRVMDRPID